MTGTNYADGTAFTVPFKLWAKALLRYRHGRQVKGAFARCHYYDESSGELVIAKHVLSKGVTYHFDEKW